MTEDQAQSEGPAFARVVIENAAIRSSYIRELEETLENSRLRLEDFSIVVAEDRKPMSTDYTAQIKSMLDGSTAGARLTITCNFQSKYRCRIRLFPDETWVYMSPGRVLMSEEEKVRDWMEVRNLVAMWVGHVYDELTSNPILRQVDEVNEQLEELLAAVNAMPDEYFSREEAEQLEKRLDDLEAQFKQYIDESDAEATEKDAQISKLEEDIEFLKKAAPNLTKRSFGRSVWNRFRGFANSPAGQVLIAAGSAETVKMLGEGLMK